MPGRVRCALISNRFDWAITSHTLIRPFLSRVRLAAAVSIVSFSAGPRIRYNIPALPRALSLGETSDDRRWGERRAVAHALSGARQNEGGDQVEPGRYS